MYARQRLGIENWSHWPGAVRWWKRGYDGFWPYHRWTSLEVLEEHTVSVGQDRGRKEEIFGHPELRIPLRLQAENGQWGAGRMLLTREQCVVLDQGSMWALVLQVELWFINITTEASQWKEWRKSNVQGQGQERYWPCRLMNRDLHHGKARMLTTVNLGIQAHQVCRLKHVGKHG